MRLTYRYSFLFLLIGSLFMGSFVYGKGEKENLLSYRNFLRSRSTTLQCDHLLTLQRLFLKNHIFFKELTPMLQTRLTNQYIKNLDGNKAYFLQKDVDYISSQMTSIFSELKKGKCKTILNVYQLYLERVGQRVEFVQKSLGRPKYKIQKNLKFSADADARGYPKTIKELNALQAKYLQWQIASNIATGMKLQESKKKVLNFYNRVLNRLQKKRKEEIFAIFLNSFADSLDPHSYFLSKEEFKDFEISMRLKFEGIGATLRDENGFTVVENLIPGGAAERSHLLKPEDKIIAVGQASGKWRILSTWNYKMWFKKFVVLKIARCD